VNDIDVEMRNGFIRDSGRMLLYVPEAGAPEAGVIAAQDEIARPPEVQYTAEGPSGWCSLANTFTQILRDQMLECHRDPVGGALASYRCLGEWGRLFREEVAEPGFDCPPFRAHMRLVVARWARQHALDHINLAVMFDGV
jgi:hypothetical protein